MEQGQIPAACQKFSESLAIRRRGGALLNLAVCRATQGRYATALGLFEQALELARRDGHADRQQFARAQIDDMKSKLSWLTVRPAPHAAMVGLEVRCDGEALPPEAWGTPRAIDAGRHTVSASVPGAKGFEVTVLVEGAGDMKSVEIPPLVPELLPIAIAPPAPETAAGVARTAGVPSTTLASSPAAIVTAPTRPRPSWPSRLVHDRARWR